MQAWLDTEPLLAGVDLAPYFYFARDRLAGALSEAQRMSREAREVLALLLSPGSVVRDSAAPRARQLSSPDSVAILQAIAERVRASDTTAEASAPFQGALVLVSARPELVTEFAALVRSLPPARFSAGTPSRLLSAAAAMTPSDKEIVRSVIREWENQTANATLASAARLALGQVQQ